MGSSLYRDTAVVLSVSDAGPADLRLTLLTQQHGRQMAVARGALSGGKLDASQLRRSSCVHVLLARAEMVSVVTQAEVAKPPVELPEATVMLSTAAQIVPVGGRSRNQFLLLVGGLEGLARGSSDSGMVLSSYLLRSLAVAGYLPSLDACAGCGSDLRQKKVWFSVRYGGLTCPDCLYGSRAVYVRAEVLALMKELLRGDWDTHPSPPAVRRKALALTEQLAAWHLDPATAGSLPESFPSLGQYLRGAGGT